MKRVLASFLVAFVLVGGYVFAQQTVSGRSYSVLSDTQGRCIFGIASAALPSNVVCQTGAIIYRSDMGGFYANSQSGWSALTLSSLASTTLSSTTSSSSTYSASTSVALTSAAGSTYTTGRAEELITLSTSGLTTDSVADLLPANSIIDAVACRVTTTITTATSWAVGDGTTAARFSAANSTMTAGTTSVGLVQMSGASTTLATGPSQISAAKLRITAAGGTPGAGAVRCTVFYRQFTAPTS